MKWYTYIICFIVIIAGVFSGNYAYKRATAKSYVHGSIDITNEFELKAFEYASSEVTFYEDIYNNNSYKFETDLKKVTNFNGVDKYYTITLNEYVLKNSVIIAGSTFSIFNIEFYSIENVLECSAELKITIKFLSNKTTMELYTADSIQASYLERYFKDNSIRLKIIENL